MLERVVAFQLLQVIRIVRLVVAHGAAWYLVTSRLFERGRPSCSGGALPRALRLEGLDWSVPRERIHSTGGIGFGGYVCVALEVRGERDFAPHLGMVPSPDAVV